MIRSTPSYRLDASAAASVVRMVALALAFLTLMPAGTAQAQAVGATMRLSQPAPGVSHRLDGLRDADPERPRVALFRTHQIASDAPRATATVRDATYYWEIFLLGIQVPFATIDDDQLARGVDKDFELLIMPAAEALSGRQRKSLLSYVRKGGSVIASGRTGQFDERGRAVDDALFAELFGAQHVSRIPAQPYGLLHTIDSRTAVGYGVPPGHRINISAQQPLTAASVVTAQALGHPYSYSGRDDAALADLTLMLSHDYEKGRAVWMRFNPQDVSRETADQTAYQRMIVNAMAHLTGANTVAVRPWPFASASTLAISALPTVGFDPLAFLGGYRDFFGLLRSANAPATFFLTADEAVGFPDLFNEMAQLGEIALSAESDDVMLGQPLEMQVQRMQRSRALLGSAVVQGFYPPGGFQDGHTVRASLDEGFGYLLLPSRPSLAPSLVRWWEDVDYRALGEPAGMVDLAFLRTRQPEPAIRQAPAPTPAIAMPLDPGIGSYVDRYEEINAAGGLYVLPFYPESERNGSARLGQLRETLLRASDNGTWIATLSDVNVWWADRANLAVSFAETERGAIAFDVFNGGSRPIDGATLELRLGDVGFDSLEADGLDAELMRGDQEGTYLLLIDRLPVGSSRIRMNTY